MGASSGDDGLGLVGLHDQPGLQDADDVEHQVVEAEAGRRLGEEEREHHRHQHHHHLALGRVAHGGGHGLLDDHGDAHEHREDVEGILGRQVHQPAEEGRVAQLEHRVEHGKFIAK